jgi:hypothetical protein
MPAFKVPQEWTIYDDFAEMHFIRRTKERIRIIASVEDACWLGLMYRGIDGKRRAYTNALTRKYYAMHRMVLNVRGSEQIDHINNDPLDNRRENLRICSQADNLKNQLPGRNAKVPYKGVTINPAMQKKPYRSIICGDGVKTHLGYYATPEEAALAYDEAAGRLHGDFALTNAKLGLI